MWPEHSDLKVICLINFWGECIFGAGYLINRTPSTVLDYKTPYELLFGVPPSYDNLRIFGSLCYAHNQRAKSDKFASRSRRCVFVGYPHGKKGWKLFDLDRQEFLFHGMLSFMRGNFLF